MKTTYNSTTIKIQRIIDLSLWRKVLAPMHDKVCRTVSDQSYLCVNAKIYSVMNNIDNLRIGEFNYFETL